MRRRTITATTEPTGRIVVTLESEEKTYDYGTLGLTFNSTDQEVLDAVSPIVQEETGVDILEEGLFTVKSVESSQNKYLFPKSPMGFKEN